MRGLVLEAIAERFPSTRESCIQKAKIVYDQAVVRVGGTCDPSVAMMAVYSEHLFVADSHAVSEMQVLGVNFPRGQYRRRHRRMGLQRT